MGLIKIKVNYKEAIEWIQERLGKPIEIEGIEGTIETFIIEPFLEHSSKSEHYICIQGKREGDEILFYDAGGVDIGNVDEKAERFLVPVDEDLKIENIQKLIIKIPKESQERIITFIQDLYKCYRERYFSYLEINPFVLQDNKIFVLDVAAKLDQTAYYLMNKEWGKVDFPSPFGLKKSKEEKFIESLDAQTGSSLKLTILNPNGRIWLMIAGGGASVVYSDTIVDLGHGKEMSNYGEYSGDPSETETYLYARTLLELMTKTKHKDGKILIIGGGIANFTNVVETFNGIVTAITEFKDKLIEHGVKIYVRRGGPNYREGLKMMYQLGIDINLPIDVYGPETHITYICSLALGLKKNEEQKENEFIGGGDVQSILSLQSSNYKVPNTPREKEIELEDEEIGNSILNRNTVSIVYGLQTKAVQQMLDFDYICKRKQRSVACIVYPFGGNSFQKFFWGTKEILIPIYDKLSEALEKNAKVDTIINFASCRSVYQSTQEMLKNSQIKTIAIIAEGVPENHTRKIIKQSKEKGITIIGPATVGGIIAGSFKIGNTGGMIDNIIASKLYRPGSVAYVSKSGGMSNELNNIISRNSNGVCEGIAIGGDKYPVSSFLDHLLRYEKNPNVKMSVLLGEIGGLDEYDVVKAMKDGRLKKPLIAWCIGTCQKIFSYTIQFGHAGSSSNDKIETADAKNKALAEAGAYVPNSFEDFGTMIRDVYQKLVKSGEIIEKKEPPVPQIPMDFSWAMRLGLIRKPSSFMSSISDERGDELEYNGVPISTIIKEEKGIGSVIGLLWFKKNLPDYASKFIEIILCLLSDHGPSVSGSHNTIVAARAGKDLVSSLTSGLLTIGPKFGGALNESCIQFSSAYDEKLTPHEFVEKMKKQNKLISGIGHKVKSIQNPDKRVELLIEYAKKNFPRTPLLEYALEVEKITTSKKPNLILNVDGAIAVLFVDLFRETGIFTKQEADEYIQMECLNGFFVLARSVGFIGHFIDQKRLKQTLYRHPWEDITYLKDEE